MNKADFYIPRYTGRERAAWFFKNKTYVDDAIRGVQDKETTLTISKNMEDIISKGGFCVKETIISVDHLKSGVLRKGLGLRWGTEKDDISVDIKVNNVEKIKRAYAEEDTDLEYQEDNLPQEENLPQKIMRRVLWHAAQSHYDPLGLLSAYMIKRKILTQQETLDARTKGWDKAMEGKEE
jgi:hypothetical protein